MIRNFKALGLALVATFAMSAVAASAASAEETFVGVLTSDEPVTLIGTQTGEAKENQLSAFGLNTRCGAATEYTGHEVESESDIQSGAKEATITPHYEECTTAGFPTTVQMNGCDYVFDFGEEIATDEYEIDSTVVCPKDQHITLEIFTDGAHENRFCDVTVTEKTSAYSGLTAIDTGDGTIDITGTIEGITLDKTPGPDSSIFCFSSAENTGVLHIDVEVEDSDSAAISISTETVE